MKRFTSFIFISLFYSGISFGETLPIRLKIPNDSTIYDNGNHKPSKVPAHELLPEVSYDATNRQISFFSEYSDLVFTLCIYDNSGMLFTTEIELSQGERLHYSVLSLSPGTYSIGIIINGRNYEGEFEITD